MRNFILISLFFVSSCATKYIIPGNRFITPESQGGIFQGQLELQQTGATLATIDTSSGTVNEGVRYKEVARTGFLLSGSLFNQFDLVWSHTGSSNSMIGGKFQFFGDPRSGKGAGHKAALALLMGGNEHESEEEDVEFELTSREYLILYGFRISENIFPYTSFSYATYNFRGKITSGSLNGLRPEFVSDSRALNIGTEFSIESFFAKIEFTYQRLATSDTKESERKLMGLSMGFSW
ncbi:MAG: hypothetical protein ACLGHN_12700 [Bacteriovoracia bacterium]